MGIQIGFHEFLNFSHFFGILQIYGTFLLFIDDYFEFHKQTVTADLKLQTNDYFLKFTNLQTHKWVSLRCYRLLAVCLIETVVGDFKL